MLPLLIHFAISEKMYKDRRRIWGISKNIKSEEMEAIVRKTAQRLQAGKDSRFQLRNIWVTDGKIRRYRRDKRILSEQQAMALRARTPPGLRCYTPLASPLTTPRDLEIPERLVRIVHEYINGSFDSNSWLVYGPGWCWHKNGLAEDGYEFSLKFDYGISNAARLLSEGQSKPAWQSLQIAMSLIGKLLSAEEPQTVFTFFDTVLSLFIKYKLPDIALAVLHQIHNMSNKLMGTMHPLSRISGFVKELGASQNMEALLKLFQVGFDDFKSGAGELGHDAVQNQLDHVRWSTELQHESNPIGKLQRLLKSCDDVNPASLTIIEIRLELARQLRRANRFQEALEIYENVAKLTSDEEGAIVLRHMSRCHEELGDLASADQNIRQAINIARAREGSEDESVLSLIADHESLLETCGAMDEATQVREYHDRLVASKYERICQAEEEEWQRYQALEGGEQLPDLLD